MGGWKFTLSDASFGQKQAVLCSFVQSLELCLLLLNKKWEKCLERDWKATPCAPYYIVAGLRLSAYSTPSRNNNASFCYPFYPFQG